VDFAPPAFFYLYAFLLSSGCKSAVKCQQKNGQDNSNSTRGLTSAVR